MPIAVLFPGQGSQCAGAGSTWTDHPAWGLVEDLDHATGAPLQHLLLEATDAELAPTRQAQLSVLLASLLAWSALEPMVDPGDLIGVAGHSLGQVTALIATGTVTPADGLRLAVARADATTAAQAARPGGLVALLGADEDVATEACSAAPGQAWVANINGAGQVVVGGDEHVLDAVAERALSLGARRARRLGVGGAFHTPLMAPAAAALRPTLDATTFSNPAVPLVTNHDGQAVTSAEGWPERLTTHLVQPVRWADCVGRLLELGADTFIEVGPGTTLSGLVRRIAPDSSVRTVSSPEDLPMAVAP